MPSSATVPFRLTRRGIVLQPDPARRAERGGVLNPAAVLRDGVTYVFYRAVDTEPANYSRILIATCALGDDGTIQTTRLDRVALEPDAPYERWADGQGGGVEDPRITLLDGVYYMAYTAYGTVGGVTAPRIALARSTDLFGWERLGLAQFAPLTVEIGGQPATVDPNEVPNKDAILFPERIGGRYALLHRPMFAAATGLPQSIWLSWSRDLRQWSDHQLVLPPDPALGKPESGRGHAADPHGTWLADLLPRCRRAVRQRPPAALSCRGIAAGFGRSGASALPGDAPGAVAADGGGANRRGVQRGLPLRRGGAAGWAD